MTPPDEPMLQGRVSMRSYFSTQHLWSAKRLARMVSELEEMDGPRPRFDIAHRSLAVSAVISAAAFMEASVSELFQDAADAHGVTGDGYLSSLGSAAIAAMAWEWRDTGPQCVARQEPVEKAQRLLECCGKPRLDAGRSPVQQARNVIRLRNDLIHFKPESIKSEERHLWEQRMRGLFSDNKLMEGSGNPWWPDHALGAGCAAWAHQSARNLVDTVMHEVAILPNYARLESSGWMGTPP